MQSKPYEVRIHIGKLCCYDNVRRFLSYFERLRMLEKATDQTHRRESLLTWVIRTLIVV